MFWRQRQSWLAEHFLSRNSCTFSNISVARTLGKNMETMCWIRTFCELFSSRTCIALIRILVWLCHSNSAIWSYSTLCFSLEIGHRWRATCRYDRCTPLSNWCLLYVSRVQIPRRRISILLSVLRGRRKGGCLVHRHSSPISFSSVSSQAPRAAETAATALYWSS